MDNRAFIKISFEVYDDKFETEMNINYYTSDYDGYEVDKRILEWFDERWQDALAKHKLDRMSIEAKEFEENEREELKRLKEKYEK